MYELVTTTKQIADEEITYEMIKHTDENGNLFIIPIDPNNSDYQAYLLSLEEE